MTDKAQRLLNLIRQFEKDEDVRLQTTSVFGVMCLNRRNGSIEYFNIGIPHYDTDRRIEDKNKTQDYSCDNTTREEAFVLYKTR